MGGLVSFLQWVWSSIGGLGGFVGLLGGGCGVFALFQTGKSNLLAKKANRIAQEANRIAADAKGVAEEANRLAGKANEISADANAISQRALSVTADQTVYKWRGEFDGESSTVFLLNDCPHEASDVHVFVRHEDQTIMDRIVDKVPAFGEIPLKDELFTQKVVEDQRSIDRLNSSAGFVYIGVGGYDVTVHVAYTTELGSRRSNTIKHRLTDGQRH